MGVQLTYKTKQRDLLLEYLEANPETHITVSDVCEYFKSKDVAIGQTTIYRHLERMVDEGLVNKYTIDPNSPACFEYIPKGHHCGDDVCFHCKCEKCGKLIHLHCDELMDLGAHLKSEHQFTLDPRRTVFYGMCEECSAEYSRDAKKR